MAGGLYGSIFCMGDDNGNGTPGGETFSSRLFTGCIYMSGWQVLDMSLPDLAVILEK